MHAFLEISTEYLYLYCISKKIIITESEDSKLGDQILSHLVDDARRTLWRIAAWGAPTATSRTAPRWTSTTTRTPVWNRQAPPFVPALAVVPYTNCYFCLGTEKGDRSNCRVVTPRSRWRDLASHH
jgi:hypothetical protein